MIQFGCAGIPLSCKGRTLKDALKEIHLLEEKDEKKLKDIVVSIFEVQLVRCFKEDKEVIFGIEGEDLEEVKKIANEMRIKINVHTPYYINLAGKDEVVEKSISTIKGSIRVAKMLNAEYVVTHLGLYGKNKTETMNNIVSNLRKIRDWAKKNNYKIKLGIEPSGKQQVFGTFEEILAVCEKVEGIYPVINFGHIHARENGSLKKRENFQKIFDDVNKKLKLNTYYCHFSGVEYENGEEKNYVPIKKGDLRFEPLAEILVEKKYNIIIISDSPLLEHDAMYMKNILLRVKERFDLKQMKKKEEKKKEILKKKEIPKGKKVVKKPTPKKEVKKEVKKPIFKKEIKKKQVKPKKVIKKPTVKKEVKKKEIKSKKEVKKVVKKPIAKKEIKKPIKKKSKKK